MMGYEPDAVGNSAPWWDALMHPDERVAVHSARSRHIQGQGSGYRSEYRAQRRDGSWIWLLEVGCIERDDHQQALRVSGVLLDITLEREQQFRVQQRLERLRTVFDYTYQFAGLLSPDGVLLESNHTALKAAGISLSDAVGKLFWETPFWTRQPAADIARLRDGIERAGRGEFVRFQYHTEQALGAEHARGPARGRHQQRQPRPVGRQPAHRRGLAQRSLVDHARLPARRPAPLL
jgi:PAS domain S-box-containing protein